MTINTTIISDINSMIPTTGGLRDPQSWIKRFKPNNAYDPAINDFSLQGKYIYVGGNWLEANLPYIRRPFIQKINFVDSTTIWEKYIVINPMVGDYSELYSIEEKNQNIYFTTATDSFNYEEPATLFKINNNGENVWQLNFLWPSGDPTTLLDSYLPSAIAITDDEDIFIFISNTLFKINKDGVVQWQNKFVDFLRSGHYVNKMIYKNQNLIFVIGLRITDASIIIPQEVLVKMDLNGVISLQKKVVYTSGCFDVDSNDNIVYADYYSTLSYDFKVVKLDPLGNLIFSKNINLSAFDSLATGYPDVDLIQINLDSNFNIYITFAETRDLDSIIIVKLDSNGNFIFCKGIRAPNLYFYYPSGSGIPEYYPVKIYNNFYITGISDTSEFVHLIKINLDDFPADGVYGSYSITTYDSSYVPVSDISLVLEDYTISTTNGEFTTSFANHSILDIPTELSTTTSLDP